jgi:hypothetical protein
MSLYFNHKEKNQIYADIKVSNLMFNFNFIFYFNFYVIIIIIIITLNK